MPYIQRLGIIPGLTHIVGSGASGETAGTKLSIPDTYFAHAVHLLVQVNCMCSESDLNLEHATGDFSHQNLYKQPISLYLYSHDLLGNQGYISSSILDELTVQR